MSVDKSVIQDTGILRRPQVIVQNEWESEENREETHAVIRDNKVMEFTLEEEFNVIDIVVRVEDYIY